MKQLHNQHGVTFVELIISIIVIGIAVTGVLQVMTINTHSSADPMLRHQAIAIAESYLDEILAKAFTDPDADGEASRYLFDDVDDYNGLPDSVVRDQGNAANPNGRAIAGLDNYAVNVNVVAEMLGPVGAQVNALRVTVSVTPPDGPDIVLAGYRTAYP